MGQQVAQLDYRYMMMMTNSKEYVPFDVLPPYPVRSFTYCNEQVRVDEVQRAMVYTLHSKFHNKKVQHYWMFCKMCAKLQDTIIRVILSKRNAGSTYAPLTNITSVWVMMKTRPMKCIFKLNHLFRISVLLLHVSALQDVAYAQFHQDPLGSLKMALLQCQNM
jgi:hypothetical protein